MTNPLTKKDKHEIPPYDRALAGYDCTCVRCNAQWHEDPVGDDADRVRGCPRCGLAIELDPLQGPRALTYLLPITPPAYTPTHEAAPVRACADDPRSVYEARMHSAGPPREITRPKAFSLPWIVGEHVRITAVPQYVNPRSLFIPHGFYYDPRRNWTITVQTIGRGLIKPTRDPHSRLSHMRGYVHVTPEISVGLYHALIVNRENLFNDAKRLLRNTSVICDCPLDTPCHGDVLLAVTNGQIQPIHKE